MVEGDLLSIEFMAPCPPIVQRVIRKIICITSKAQSCFDQSQSTHKLQYLSWGLVLKNGATMTGRTGCGVDRGSGTRSTLPKIN